MRRSIWLVALVLAMFVGGVATRAFAGVVGSGLPSEDSTGCEFAPADDDDPGGGDPLPLIALCALGAHYAAVPPSRSFRLSLNIAGVPNGCPPRLGSRGPPRRSSV